MTAGIYSMRACDVMTRGADTIGAEATVQAAVEKMVNLGLSALPVTDKQGVCVGMLTKTDVIQLAGYLEDRKTNDAGPDLAALILGIDLEDAQRATVESVMTKRVVCAGEDDTVPALAEKMLKHELHHLPVCDDRRKIVGVVSSMDLVKAITEPIRG